MQFSDKVKALGAFFLLCCVAAALGGATDCGVAQKVRSRRSVSEVEPEYQLLAGNYSGLSYDWTVADLEGCGLDDVFDVFFVVYDHIWLLFKPRSTSGQCGSFIFDSQVYTDEQNATYSVGILQSLPPVISTNQNLSEAFNHSYLIGNVTAEDLLDAIEVFDGEYGGEYHFITNNCAIKVIDVMYFLGLDVHDRALLSWINGELQTQAMIDMFRSSTNITALYPTLNNDQILAKNNTELFGTLIDFSIQKALENYATDLVFYQSQKAPAVAPSAPKAPAAANTPVAAKSPVAAQAPANGKVSMGSSLYYNASIFLSMALFSFLILVS